MKYSALLAGLCLSGALASPVGRRAMVTDVNVVTTTVYVTDGEPAPTTPPAPGNFAQVGDPANGDGDVPKDKPAPPPSSSAPPPPPPSTPTPTPTPTPEPEPEPSSSPEPSHPPPTDDYQSKVLDQHNIHRSNHSASPLTWSDDLESSAKQLAESCVYGHNTKYGGGGYGQNIGYGLPIDAMLTNSMYNGEMTKYQSVYGQASPNDFESWGHFSQMVWKKTKHVGCYTHKCAQLEDPNHDSPVPNVEFSVCNYDPPGNYKGEYADNVGKPLGKPVVNI